MTKNVLTDKIDCHEKWILERARASLEVRDESELDLSKSVVQIGTNDFMRSRTEEGHICQSDQWGMSTASAV